MTTTNNALQRDSGQVPDRGPAGSFPPNGASPGRTGAGSRAMRLMAASGMLPALLLLIVAGTVLSPAFLTATNFSNVLRLSAVLGLLAIGQALVVLSGGGGIDLSVASVAAAAAVVGAQFQSLGLTGVILISLLAGGFFGLINGLGVTTAGLQPFIVTLATLTIARGVAFQLTNAQPLYLKTEGLSVLSTGSVGPVPVPILIMLGTAIVAQLVLSRTVFGRNLYAIGGNEEAAFGNGVNVRLYRISVYVISGLLAGLAGVLGMAQLNTADPNFANGYELSAIAAVVVGGALLSGGKGSIVGTYVGVLIIALVSNLLNLLNVNPWTNLMVTGLIIIVVVALNRRQSGSGPDRRVWKGAPLYAMLLLGTLLLFVI
ncbi:ABC transporter permease [Arthrobacter sp. I2-34]|uniref:ABC transporter permease n=1 Tax=Arthrobacter hankyongi TaxID=2904801 RepID=A0ABS9LCM3_9MICC|nr:ABC transporter permease [Arthrobacter hankyongi]MCG2624424.1 ABC transporter permease [Arthrobacter hankyongi]